MNRMIVRVLLVAALIVSAAEAQAGNKFTRYLRDRRDDLADVFRLRLEIPKRSESFAVKARATSLLQLGAVRFRGEAIGMDRRAIGIIEEERTEFGASLLYYSNVRSDVVKGNQFTDTESDWSKPVPRHLVRNGKSWDDGRERYLSFGLELQALFLPGLDVGLYPEEFADFALGFFGADPFDDDLSRIQKRAAKAFGETHTQAIRAEEPFIFDRTLDDELAPYEYGPSAPAGKR